MKVGPVTIDVAPILSRAHLLTATVYVPPVAGTYAMAISVPVPFDQYQFPPRPAELKPLPYWYPEGVRIDSNPANPLAPVSTTMVWVQHLDIRLAGQTPGEWVVTVAGRTIAVYDLWDYESRYVMGPYDPSTVAYLATLVGQSVTVTITPRRVGGAWAGQILIV
jgi:hypothetical protein